MLLLPFMWGINTLSLSHAADDSHLLLSILFNIKKQAALNQSLSFVKLSFNVTSTCPDKLIDKKNSLFRLIFIKKIDKPRSRSLSE